MPQQLDAVVAGYLGVDLAPGFLPAAEGVPPGDLLRPGKLTEVGPLEISSGGVVANTGLAMAVLGSRVALMGLVGHDALGDLLIGLLDGRGASLHIRRTDSAPTAYGIVLAPPGVDRMFLECPGCNATFTAADIDYDTVAGARLFHFGYPPLMPAMLAENGAELEAMFRRVRETGVATSLDMSLPDPDGAAAGVDWPALLGRVLPHVDIFTPSVEELLHMLAPDRWAELVERAAGGDVVDLITDGLLAELASDAIALGARIVLLKAGHRGGYLRVGDITDGVGSLSLSADDACAEGLCLPALPVDPARFVNACGAGDAAVAGFLTGLLRGDGLRAAGSLAMQVGRDSLYGADTTSGLANLGGH